MFEYERFILPNGLRIILVPLPNTTVISTLVLVKGGSRFEKDKNAGRAHFIEHMLFKGGKKYPSSFELAKAVDTVGAQYNAFTSKEVVGYYVKNPLSAGTTFGLEILEDMLLYNDFSDAEIETEKKIITEEIKTLKDDTERWLTIAASPHLLFNGHALGREISGTEKSVNELSRRDLLDYRSDFYKAGNMIISIAGNINTQRITEEINARFGPLPPGTPAGWQRFDEIQTPSEKIFMLSRKEKEQVNSMIVTAFPGYFHEDSYPCFLLLEILGGGESFRLFQEVREKRGLVYSIGSGMQQYEETGVSYTCWGTGQNDKRGFFGRMRQYLQKTGCTRVEESLKAVLYEYKKIRENPVSDEELARVKSAVKGNLEMEMANTMRVAMFYGQKELLLDEVMTFDEHCRKLDEVTKEDILRVARIYLAPEKLKLAIAAQKKFCHYRTWEKILEENS